MEQETLSYLTRRSVSASELLTGSWLPKVARENFATCQRLSKNRPLAPDCALTWGSCCSGSEGARFVVDAMNEALTCQGSLCRLTHAFSCEVNPEKRKWISFVSRAGHRALQPCPRSPQAERDCSEDEGRSKDAGQPTPEQEQADLPCIFTNILDMGNDRAECWQHAGFCRVPCVDVLIIGTLCKDMSRANPGIVRQQAVLQHQRSKGGSAQTFRGFLSYLDAHHPLVVLFENVDSMEDAKAGGVSNADIFHAEVSSRGYESQSVMLDSAQFGLAARRRRVYILLVRVGGSPLLSFEGRPLGAVFQTFRGLLSGCLRKGPCASEILLPPTDQAVQDEQGPPGKA